MGRWLGWCLMAKQKLTQVTVQGLATNPNANALPAGSCAVLQNAVMRRPGIISPTPSFISRITLEEGGSSARKLMYSDFDSTVLAVSDGSFTTITLPDTLGATVAALPADTTGGTRPLNFLPGRTQTSFSHFRSLITERDGIIVNKERWAGLPPPAGMYITSYTSADGFLLDTQGVSYRAHFALESTEDTKPYIVDGPVSAIGSLINDTGSTCGTQMLIFAPPNEPFVIPTDCKLYLVIYRSSQAVVDFVTELPDDFCRVAKVEITDFTLSLTPVFIDLVTDEARANGTPLYTNGIGQLGAQASQWAPPAASDICVFKDTTFYANRASLNTLSLTIPGPFGVLLSNRDRLIGIGQRDVISAATTNHSPNIVFSDPDDIIGVVPGQLLQMSGFDFGTLVVSVNTGTSTVTVSNNSTFTASGVVGTFLDMIKVTTHPENGSGVTQTGRILFFDFDAVAAGDLPGFRMMHPAVDMARAVEGITLTLTYTWPTVGVLSNFTVSVTNGQNYSPAYTGDYVTNTDPLISLNDIRPNRVFASTTGLPEAVPVANFYDVGAGTILKMWANQSALFFFCTDGLWKITGDGTAFSVYQIDPTVYLVHPDAVGSLNNLAYAWVSDGIATITEDGGTTISTDAIGPQLRALHTVAVQNFAPYSWGVSLAGDSFRNEVWLIVNSVSHEVPETSAAAVITYNDDTKNFSNQAPSPNELQEFLSAVYAPNVSRTTFLGGGSGEESAFFLPSDYDTSDPQLYLPMTVWFNPNQTEDKGNLKQWMDLNYFTANYANSEDPDQDSDWLKAVFSATAETDDATANTVNVNPMVSLKRDIHYLVPRRTALSDQQQIGFRTFTLDADGVELTNAFYVEIQGFTMRYRIASDTLKR